MAPEAVRPGDRFRVFVMFHVPGYTVRASEGQVVDQGVDSVEVAEGTNLTVRLIPMDEGVFELDEPEDSCLWRPPSQRTEFRLRAAKDLEEGLYDLRAEFWCGQVRLNHTYVEVEVSVDAKRHRARRPEVVQRLPRSAFASYSRRDKIRVAERVESLRSVGIDVFLDCLDIHPADKWQEVLERELASREALLLFWSTPASKSEWVEKEWRFALERHGPDCILPNALESPQSCPPPKDLAHLQFGSVLTELTEKWRRDAADS